jgi:hypothetical protein
LVPEADVWTTALPMLMFAAFFVGCPVATHPEPDRPADSNASSVVRAVGEARSKGGECEVGSRPQYYVPADAPPRIVGCADLSVSDKPVEFSVNPELTQRTDYICVNPAYRGRGELGFYIPAVCSPDPISPRLEVVDARVPRQGTPRYQFVIWGTTDLGTDEVTATFADGEAGSAIFDVDPQLAEALHARRPFSIFVTELPRVAACAEIVIEAAGPGRSRDGDAGAAATSLQLPGRVGRPRAALSMDL